MFTRLKHLSITRQIILSALVVLGVVFTALTIAVSMLSQQSAQAAAEKTLIEDADLMRDMLDSYFENIRVRSVRQGNFFENWLGGAIKIDPEVMKTGELELPILKSGENILNSNQTILKKFKDLTGDEAAIILIKDGKVYRAATLLKKNDVYRDGSIIPDKDPVSQAITKGQDYTGLVVRNGKYYFSNVKVIKDNAGKPFAALSVRISLEDELQQIRALFGNKKIGETGYAFIINPSLEEKDIGEFVLHPKFQGKTIAEAITDLPTKQALQNILASKKGITHYPLADSTGQLREKIVSISTSEKWHWTIVLGTWHDEFMKDSIKLRNTMFMIDLISALIVCASIFMIVHNRLKPLSSVVDAVSDIGAGNLKITVENANAQSQNEVFRLGAALNQTVENVRTLVYEANQSANKIVHSADDLQSTALKVLDSSSHQASAAAKMAAAVEQMTGSISQVANSADHAVAISAEARSTTQEGRAVVQHSVHDMEYIAGEIQDSADLVLSLGERSRQVSSIVEMIREVADQTNLLALNAAIEAARAGEQGRGFAVVADEVRKLAERTALSTQEITSTIQAIVQETHLAAERMQEVRERVSNGVESAQQAGVKLALIDEKTSGVVQVVEAIAGCMQEQSDSSQSIANSVSEIVQMAEDNASAAEVNKNSAGVLQQVSAELQTALGRFKI